LPTAVQDSFLGTLLEQLNIAEQNLIIKTNDFGPQHSEILKLNAAIADLKTKITKRVDGILASLTVRVAALKASFEALENEVHSAKTNDIFKAHESQPYYDAKRQLEQLQRFGQILNMKIAAEKIDVSLPKSAMVEIIEQAQPGLHPVRPNK